MMKFLVILGAGLLIPAPANAAAPAATTSAPGTKASQPDPASIALAQQILTVAFPPEKRSQMYASMMDSIMGQARKELQGKIATGDKDFDALLDRSMQRMQDEMKATINAALPDYFESFARAYAREFSRDDLQAILAFVKTPAGERYFQRLPALLQDPEIQAANQRLMAQLANKLPTIQRETMRDVQDYVEKKEKEAKPAAPVPVS